MGVAVPEAVFAGSAVLGAGPDVAASPWVVMKFGGTSVASAEHWRTIAGLVENRRRDGLKPLVVHSALEGVSNALNELLDDAADTDPQPALSALRAQHDRLVADLGLDGPAVLDDYFEELARLVAGVRLVREVSVRVRVRVMALGELLATRIGAAWLDAAGIETEWLDARELLTSEDRGNRSEAQNYLSAICGSAPDPSLAARLDAAGKVVLTQGFIASNLRGETVLLGRGGSDTSAACFAAKLGARRLEIWTDVPGMYTADPRLVPSARLLVELQFDEAQELASMGSKVLHPRCLSPLRAASIPLFIRCTSAPQVAGTVVSAATREVEPQVKGISTRAGTVLISMSGAVMWHEVGFLAEAFARFRYHGVSIDLVSTSETNVTVSIDTADEMFSEDVRRALLRDLEALCRVRLIPDCAVVSLVGRRIRTILPRLAPALEVFEEEKIHLVTQAANDLNFSFVIDQAEVPRIVSKLHSSMIRESAGSSTFGPSWEELFTEPVEPARRPETWWQRKRNRLLAIGEREGQAYVYDLETVRSAARALLSMASVDRVLYAVKANFNPDILRALAGLGVDFDCVSPGEVRHLHETVPDIDASRLLFTPNFAPREEYAWALGEGLQVTLDNLHPLREWPELFTGRRLFVRLDPGQGRGHHEHVKTAGMHSKFGIPRFEIEELERLVDAAGAQIVGLHAHAGSGVLDPENWRNVAQALAAAAERFPDVEVLDLGGGLGVPERPGDSVFDVARLDEILSTVREASPRFRLWLEPGRYLVAHAGVLLAHVTQVKGKGDMRYVGVSTGMNSLIRPALYGAYHEIVNLTRLHKPATEKATVVGPICETGDRLGSDRLLPPSKEGDVMLIANTGAYGHVMGSRYNLRDIAPEIII
ncbi:MAG TPA: bifunctional aspartate kinase/diaminopimelate decarboxylase, partial [Woeseiaceae bacterium]|nr:bifunctional aspartate kinase/diaminopimelate decarboxylase [Woeseiaceae bacterium]